MKIAININELTLQQNTGVKVYTREIVKALRQVDKGNEYFLYANCRDADLSRLCLSRLYNEIAISPDAINRRLYQQNFKIKPSKSRLPFWTYLKLSREIKKDQPDILFMPIQAVPFFKKPKNMKLVVTVHDLAFLLFPNHFTRKDRFLLNFHTKRTTKMADKIIAPSEATKRDIIKFYGINESKIKVVWHGVETRHCLVSTELENKPYILFVGSIQPRKNITGLIKAFETVKENSDFHVCHSDRSERGTSKQSGGICKHKTLVFNKNNFKNPFYQSTDPSARSYRRSVGMTTNILSSLQLIICGGKGWMADETYKRAKESKFSDDIIFTGSVSDEERDELYKNALIFALPSFYEGFGLPVLEAMSYGIPCVVGNNSSLSEIAGKSALFVDANNPSDIAEKINLLLSNSELRKDLSYRGIENIKKFSWNKAAEKTLEVFEEMMR